MTMLLVVSLCLVRPASLCILRCMNDSIGFGLGLVLFGQQPKFSKCRRADSEHRFGKRKGCSGLLVGFKRSVMICDQCLTCAAYFGVSG